MLYSIITYMLLLPNCYRENVLQYLLLQNALLFYYYFLPARAKAHLRP